MRESGGDFSAVTGGTRVLSDWIVVRVAVNPGEAFIDRMIAMVEGAKRQKTPNEIALTILLIALTLVFLLATATLLPFSLFSVDVAKPGTPVTITALVALLVCLIPTTIGGLLSAIGVAGMSRMMAANVIATSGRAVEAAGDVDVLLLDKTGTITLGNRQAAAFLPAEGVTRAAARRRRATELARRRDPRGPQHRRPGQAALQPARARLGSLEAHLRAVFRADPHERREHRHARRCAKAPPTPSRSTSRRCGFTFPRARDAGGRGGGAPGQHAAGGGRRRRACSASSSSRTSSKAASRSGSASCAAWASRP